MGNAVLSSLWEGSIVKQLCNSVIVGFALLCAVAVQAVADDIRPENIDLMFRADMELYSFYTLHDQGLKICREMCPENSVAVEDAAGVFAVLLDDAAAVVRSEHNTQIDFVEHDKAVAGVIRNECAKESACAYCDRLVERVQMYGEVGLPDEISRVALFHTANYAQTPEREFEDGLVMPVRYTWSSAGNKRSCIVNIPKTWGRVASASTARRKEYRSALGNGIPFFAIEYEAAPKIHGEQKLSTELQRKISIDGLSKEYGDVEILAQGVQKLGSTLSSWVMFSTGSDGSADSGYYYNWYMIVGDTALSFRSGVSGAGGLPMAEQEYIFKKYYHTLREIALSSVIQLDN